jgi:site-specific recombinase XerD
MLDEFGNKVRIIFDKRADAVAKEAQINQRKYDAKLVGRNLRKQRYSLDKALEDFELSKADLRPGTKKRYKSIIQQFRFFIEALNLKYVDEFTPDHGTMFFNELLKERLDPKGNTDKIVKAKPKTINMYIQVIKALFREEFIKDHIKSSPVIHLKNLKADKKAPEYYTDAELKMFFAQKMEVEYRNFFFALLHTGMRFAELANLTWNEVDFKRRLIHVRSTEKFKTKTSNAERSIPITEALFSLLTKMKKSSNTDLVFTTPNGHQIRERRALAICKKIAEEAKLTSNAFLHKFRHTYATILVQRGERLEDIKELLGHSSIKETEIYAHHKSDHLHNKVTHLDKIIDIDDEGQS